VRERERERERERGGAGRERNAAGDYPLGSNFNVFKWL
jgi:hypothetical protein